MFRETIITSYHHHENTWIKYVKTIPRNDPRHRTVLTPFVLVLVAFFGTESQSILQVWSCAVCTTDLAPLVLRMKAQRPLVHGQKMTRHDCMVVAMGNYKLLLTPVMWVCHVLYLPSERCADSDVAICKHKESTITDNKIRSGRVNK